MTGLYTVEFSLNQKVQTGIKELNSQMNLKNTNYFQTHLTLINTWC